MPFTLQCNGYNKLTISMKMYKNAIAMMVKHSECVLTTLDTLARWDDVDLHQTCRLEMDCFTTSRHWHIVHSAHKLTLCSRLVERKNPPFLW